jgi:hypothetical protein
LPPTDQEKSVKPKIHFTISKQSLAADASAYHLILKQMPEKNRSAMLAFSSLLVSGSKLSET